ncbi:serine/threonine-protein kinase SRPK3 [Pyronema domesticum]|nr:serine/threonine-protein kinase SRPK3 [Pyronema domesticum]
MSSPPPNPSAELPSSDRSQWRFHPITTPTEWIEEYRPNWFHPIQPGDVFKDGRYKVIRKLGYGAFSTVWLAIDEQVRRYAALKVLSAKESANTQELTIHQRLAEFTPSQPGAKHVVALLDSFKHHGPNGIHLFLVFEPMGPSANSMAEHLSHKSPKANEPGSGRLDFLHQNGIVHGDVQPGNLLFAVNVDLGSAEEEKLKQDFSQKQVISEPPKRLDGKVDKWAPRYLAVAQSLTSYVDTSSAFTVKISDMGTAFWRDEPKKPVTPVGLRAPELIFGDPFDQSIDVWSIGCLLFEFLTGTLLVMLCWGSNQLEECNDDHLLQLTDVLGDLPEEYFSRWAHTKKYFGPNRQRIDPDPNAPIKEDEGCFDDPESRSEPLEKFFCNEKPSDIDEAKSSMIISLLRRILQYDPKNRPSAVDILEDPWFKIRHSCTKLPSISQSVVGNRVAPCSTKPRGAFSGVSFPLLPP